MGGLYLFKMNFFKGQCSAAELQVGRRLSMLAIAWMSARACLFMKIFPEIELTALTENYEGVKITVGG